MTARRDVPDAAAAVVDGYFTALVAAAAQAHAPISADELAELRAHVSDRLAGTEGTAADAQRVLAELGDPATLARAFADDTAGDGDGPRSPALAAGRVLGMPYDLRTPTSDRFASRLWDPSDPHVLVPRVLGLGWTVNFGALAVKARLVRPDDEDAPFAAVPPSVVTATLAAPVAVVLAIGVLMAVRWHTLPAVVPSHWNALGRVDGYASRGAAMLLVALLAVVPLLFAVGVHARRRSAVNRVVASAFSLGLGVVALAILAQTFVSLAGGTGMWATWAGIAGFVVAPLLLLAGVSRLGRAAEQRRDLTPSKGRAR